MCMLYVSYYMRFPYYIYIIEIRIVDTLYHPDIPFFVARACHVMAFFPRMLRLWRPWGRFVEPRRGRVGRSAMMAMAGFPAKNAVFLVCMHTHICIYICLWKHLGEFEQKSWNIMGNHGTHSCFKSKRINELRPGVATLASSPGRGHDGGSCGLWGWWPLVALVRSFFSFRYPFW